MKHAIVQNGITWYSQRDAANHHHLGLIPSFLSAIDPRPAVEQFDERYRSGGGWHRFKGFRMLTSGDLHYTGDPNTRLLWEAALPNGETVRVYESAWVAVVQPDGSYEIARMD